MVNRHGRNIWKCVVASDDSDNIKLGIRSAWLSGLMSQAYLLVVVHRLKNSLQLINKCALCCVYIMHP